MLTLAIWIKITLIGWYYYNNRKYNSKNHIKSINKRNIFNLYEKYYTALTFNGIIIVRNDKNKYVTNKKEIF